MFCVCEGKFKYILFCHNVACLAPKSIMISITPWHLHAVNKMYPSAARRSTLCMVCTLVKMLTIMDGFQTV